MSMTPPPQTACTLDESSGPETSRLAAAIDSVLVGSRGGYWKKVDDGAIL